MFSKTSDYCFVVVCLSRRKGVTPIYGSFYRIERYTVICIGCLYILGSNASTHTDTLSLGSGSEFSGWRGPLGGVIDTGGVTVNTPDVQSVSSLDLYTNKNGTREDVSPQDIIQIRNGSEIDAYS